MHNYIRLQETYHAQVRSISSVLTQHRESHNSLNDQMYNTILLHIYIFTHEHPSPLAKQACFGAL